MRFACDSAALIPFLNESEWAEDYAQARVDVTAFDRIRFRQRIKEMDARMNDVFSADNRLLAYSRLGHL